MSLDWLGAGPFRGIAQGLRPISAEDAGNRVAIMSQVRYAAGGLGRHDDPAITLEVILDDEPLDAVQCWRMWKLGPYNTNSSPMRPPYSLIEAKQLFTAIAPYNYDHDDFPKHHGLQDFIQACVSTTPRAGMPLDLEAGPPIGTIASVEIEAVMTKGASQRPAARCKWGKHDQALASLPLGLIHFLLAAGRRPEAALDLERCEALMVALAEAGRDEPADWLASNLRAWEGAIR